MKPVFCSRGLRTFNLYNLSFTVTLNVAFGCNILWNTTDQSIIIWMKLNSAKQAASFFLLWRQKALFFLMSWAPSAVTYHSRSDTFIINYIQPVWWHPTLAWGKQWVVQGVLCCWAAQRTLLIITHVSPESISITHWPFFSIWKDGCWRWLAACMKPICGTAKIQSGDLALSPSHQNGPMEGGTSRSIIRHPPLLHPLEI